MQLDLLVPITRRQRFKLMIEHKEGQLIKLEEVKQHVAYLEEKTTLYQAILEHRSSDTTNPGNWDIIQHMHRDAFYSPTVRKYKRGIKRAILARDGPELGR